MLKRRIRTNGTAGGVRVGIIDDIFGKRKPQEEDEPPEDDDSEGDGDDDSGDSDGGDDTGDE